MKQETLMTRNKPASTAKITTIRITLAGLFMAMNIAFSSFGIPVPGGHLYLCDVIICLAAILLNPIEAFAVGGIGSFLGDLFFYPAPMFVSLVTHGLQAVVISLFAHKVLPSKPKLAAGIGCALGVILMVTGYTLGKIFIYSTLEYAIMKLPYEFAQGTLGAVLGMILAFRCGLRSLFERTVNKNR